ncbi:MAG TPA: hypothetical protein VD790_07845 [Thermoleophilaceae bacterium]|nr:hypothetical protein [Thermoleophilaceae bacterium]
MVRRLENLLTEVVDTSSRQLAAVTLFVVDRAIATGVVERIADRLLAAGTLEHTIDRVFDDRRVVDETVSRLLESEDLWRLVDAIAQSPAVTEAIARQSVGFADQVAGEVRAHARRADARLERRARSILRRPDPPASTALP